MVATNSVVPSYYFDHARTEMLAFIPPQAQRILDVGCGAGGFASQLKKSLNAEMWGIEIDGGAAARAQGIFEKLLVGDATVLVDELPDGYFDCIICNDLLEHLVDPFNFLDKIRKKLAGNGVVVASVPNVRYIKNLFNLIVKKDWHYQNEGVLDRTHLRFFTRRSMLRSLSENRWITTSCDGTCPTKMRVVFTLLNWLTAGQLADTRFMNFAYVFKSS